MSATKPGAEPSGDTRLVVSDFGPIARAEVTLRPLTVFVGPSHTGKSVLATLLYALHRNALWRALTEGRDGPASWSSVGSRREAAPLLVEEQVHSWLRDTEQSSAVPTGLEEALRTRCEEDAAHALEREVCRCFGVADLSALCRRSGPSTRSTVEWRVSSNEDASSLRFEFGSGRDGPVVAARLSNLASIPAADTRTWRRSFGDGRGMEDPWLASLAEDLSRSLLRGSFGPALRSAYFLPADRRGIVHRHDTVVGDSIRGASSPDSRRAGGAPFLSGAATDLLAQFAAIDRNADDRTRWHSLAAEIENRILGGSVRVEPSAVRSPEFAYRPTKWNGDDLPLFRASAMVSSLAPAVLCLRHVVGPGEVLIIEEPEVHVHPAKQTELARQLVRIVRAGIRVVVTTHSEWLLEQLGNLTQLSDLPADRRKGIEEAELALDPKEVGVWLFQHKPEQGGAVVEEVTIEPESGLFPTGYDEIGLALYRQSASIFNRRERLKE